MNAPFDIIELRSNIGDDANVEQMLLSLFVRSSDESLQLLSSKFPAAIDAEYDQLWKTHMHQIKGAALNIGAQKLVDLTLRAQDNFTAPLEIKKPLLDAVQKELRHVAAYIDSLHILPHDVPRKKSGQI